MSKILKIALIVGGVAALGAGALLIWNWQKGRPQDGGPGGPGTGEGPMGMPPMRQEIRESLESLFAQYNDAVPKKVLIDRLNDLGKTLATGKGPQAHQISVAPSKDGLTFEYRGDPDENGFIAEKAVEGIIKQASVPDAVVGPDGKIRLYFVDAHETRKIIAAVETLDKGTIGQSDLGELYKSGYLRDNNPFSLGLQSDDKGEKFDIKALRILNFPDDLSAADPSIVLTESGGYHLYFFCVPRDQIPQGGDIAEAETHYVGYASSDDGQTFEYEGIAYDKKGTGLTDPEVYRFGSDYKLFLQGEKIRVIDSTDSGKTFTATEKTLDLSTGDYKVGGPMLRIGEVKGQYRMYFCAQYKEVLFTASASSKDGKSWTFNPLPKIGGRGSMAPVPLGNSYRFYFHH